ncbi:hypothetical protein D917_10747 [Trichinella nativa]|uniref:Uncharacterized protein n=1 Tax=Trichinella nativa TaxID=6335 RepID=A0A1Y3E9A1_9BILA|nr:hypothetical protein D917_10747 [Trichinella nativa]
MSTRICDISVLIDFDSITSHPSEDLLSTPIFKLSTHRFSQKAKESPYVIFDEGYRSPSFTTTISDQFVSCNLQLSFRRIYPSGIVEAFHCVSNISFLCDLKSRKIVL